MGEFTVHISDECAEPDAWDETVEAAGAPLFYRSEVLRSYQRNPLQDTLGQHYLTVRRRGRRSPEAVLPLFQTPAYDPLGVLGSILPSYTPAGAPLLLSHMWHWYDTQLPARSLTPALVDAVCQAMGELATANGAQAFGFINVLEGGELARTLPHGDLKGALADARFTMDLSPFRTADDYVAALPRAARQDMRRQLRRAEAAGARIAVETDPSEAGLYEIGMLCHTTAGKHGNPGWYDPDRLTGFALGAGAGLRLVTVRIEGRPVVASLSFADGTRFHNWTAGSVPSDQLPFSPYAVLLYGSLDAALDEGCGLLEGGRRNDAWKARLGMVRRDLGCWLAET